MYVGSFAIIDVLMGVWVLMIEAPQGPREAHQNKVSCTAPSLRVLSAAPAKIMYPIVELDWAGPTPLFPTQ